ncbi:ATP-binding protein [Motilibacter peucedani]|uniref:ATP-binding protein n=1 Tax=Motilibacter peucedani TaxID=598650 RepID=UPI001E4D9BC0|nr:LuxR family transcriptional regulator [Motilibacter peucedani]
MDLVERDHETALLRAVVDGARSGTGGGVALAGEAGTGKSALLAAACVRTGGVRVLRGGCDPLSTPRPLGPFRDIAAQVPSAPLQHQPDVPLPSVCEELYDWLRSEPTVLVVEDLHWVDAATAEVLRFLVRRIGSMPLALLVSYRDLEVGQSHPARPLLGDLALNEDVRTLPLGPLTVAGVRTLLSGTALDPERVHRITGGNPYFVTEIAKDPDRPLPGSVRDAVLARTAEISAEDFEVLQLVATAPDGLGDRALAALGVGLPTLRRLGVTGLLTHSRDGIALRHELARQAVESTIPPGGAHRLHRRLLDALERLDPRDPAVLTHHAVSARDAGRAARYAREAAEQAARAGSHSEAAAFLEIALEHLADAPPQERAELLQLLGFEQYMTSRLEDAVANVRATFALWRIAADLPGLSAAHERCAVYRYYQGRRKEAEAHAEQAAQFAVDAGSGPALGAARATRAYLAHMRSELDLTVLHGQEAATLGQEHALPGLVLRGQLLGCYVRLGKGDERAREEILEHIETARSSGWDELASTGYSQVLNLDVEQRRLRAAEHVLEESLPFARARDIPICQHWQTALRSRLRLAEGRWKAAVEDAHAVLEEDGMPLAWLWPHLVVALVALRSGEAGDAHTHLDEAWALAGRIDEPLRTLHVLSALAEAQWLTGEADPRVTELAPQVLQRFGATPGTSWAVGELRAWLHRLDLLVESPLDVAPPYALAGDNRARDAAVAWQRIGEPFSAAMVLSDSADVQDRLRAIEELDALGAYANADRLRVDLRRDSDLHVPARARASTRANPGGLTNRQLDVARLVARGLTNSEIATRLFISPKTADHHVSAVLTKLGLASRRSVVVRADELGLA